MKLSISRIKLFKACRRAYELKYVEGLEPVETSEALQTGLNYHRMIEDMYVTGEIENDFSKECAMVTAYKKYVFPKFNMSRCEDWVEFPLTTGDSLIGRVDGLSMDGCVVEHKTTSAEITEEYEYNLQWDEQILAYMLMTGSRKIYYTVCRKPSIRQKKGETEEEFFERMVTWYDEDTKSKIRMLVIERTDKEVEDFRRAVEQMAIEMKYTAHYYRNTAYCKHCGRMCEYAPICLQYDPSQEYLQFTREKKE